MKHTYQQISAPTAAGVKAAKAMDGKKRKNDCCTTATGKYAGEAAKKIFSRMKVKKGLVHFRLKDGKRKEATVFTYRGEDKGKTEVQIAGRTMKMRTIKVTKVAKKVISM